MDSEKEPIFAAQGSSEAGKDEQPLYYDKANHPILVRERERESCRYTLWLLACCKMPLVCVVLCVLCAASSVQLH